MTGWRALVKDRRRVTLAPGIQNLAFIDVSAQLRPETALLHSDGGQLGVLEGGVADAGRVAIALARRSRIQITLLRRSARPGRRLSPGHGVGMAGWAVRRRLVRALRPVFTSA